ncbi:MAG: iron ABC transporter permease [Ruminococcaceae bacterium]|nr:iron ABC transporter permease [Oscillospiraceae bacterium]
MEKNDLTAYNQYIRKKWTVLLITLGLFFVSVVLSLSAGSASLSMGDILRTLFGGGNRQENAIVWNVRMPRVATATVVGIALALSGCVMQNVLRNPLASASTLGVSQGASFGAAVAIVCFGAGIQVNAGGAASALTVTNPTLVTLCAFLGGITTTAVILALARFRGTSPATMVLAGVAISSMFTGGTALVQYFCDDVMVATVVYWTFGSLGRAGWSEIAVIAALTGASFAFFYCNRWNYNAMESGTHTAKSLGVPVDRLILVSMALCALIASVAVAFVGCISFIGLIAAHIMRRFVGNDYRFLIPGSALCGGVLLLLSDIVSRVLIAPTVLPIGALTSFLGAPLFLYLIVKGGRGK